MKNIFKHHFTLPMLITVIVLLDFLIIIPFRSISAAEGGGTSGAEFLTAPPTSRYSGMGNVLDGLDQNIEGIHYNPAVLATLSKINLQVNVNPYPNEVSHDQLSVGFPLFGGVGATSLQIFNTGGFTYVNENLQPEETIQVYDAAITAGYSRYVWKSLSAGTSLKAVYRTLGEYHATAFGLDLGSAYWFETPHIGRRPMPPKKSTLSNKLERDKQKILKEKQNRVDKASKSVELLKKKISELQKQKLELEKTISHTEASEKKASLLAKKDDILNKIDNLSTQLEEKKAVFDKQKNEIEFWAEGEIKKVELHYANIQADLANVQKKRASLYSVIKTPGQDLQAKQIDSVIDETIEKTNKFMEDRVATLKRDNESYTVSRKKIISEINDEIEKLQQQISDEFGKRQEKLSKEISDLTEKKQSLEEAYEQSKNEPLKSELQKTEKQLADAKRSLSQIENDPWYKKLQKRIQEKKNEIQSIKKDIGKNNNLVNKQIVLLQKKVKEEIDSFQALRIWLKREIKMAKLKRELDLLKAKNKTKKEKARKEYKQKEQALYLKLLAIRYKHEFKILEAQLDSIKKNYNNRKYKINSETQKSIENLEDAFAFQQRFLNQKIEELQKKVKQTQNDNQKNKLINQLNETKNEITQREKTLKDKVQMIKSKEKKQLEKLQEEYERNVANLQWQIKLTKLLYLQTDTPYLNTSVNVAIQNVGSHVKFVNEGYPLPTVVHMGIGYAAIHTDMHALKIGFQWNLPIYNVPSIGIGVEYSFLDSLYIRTGYTISSLTGNFSAGIGAHVRVGFTQYNADYTFKPIKDYGIVHSFGISMRF